MIPTFALVYTCDRCGNVCTDQTIELHIAWHNELGDKVETPSFTKRRVPVH